MAFKTVFCVLAITLMVSCEAQVKDHAAKDIPVNESPATTPAGQVMSASQLHQGGYGGLGGYQGGYAGLGGYQGGYAGAGGYQGHYPSPADPANAANLPYPPVYAPSGPRPYYRRGSDSISSEEWRHRYGHYY